MSFKSILDEIENNLKKILDEMSIPDVLFSVEPSKPGFGDASSNIAFLLAKQLKKSPKEIAILLSDKYAKCQHTLVLKSEAHASGYLNFYAEYIFFLVIYQCFEFFIIFRIIYYFPVLFFF